jgi:hypothetical protein
VRTLVRIAAATAVVLVIAALVARRAGEKGVVRPDVPVAGPIRVLPPDSVIAGPVVAESTVGNYRIRLLKDTVANDRMVDITQNGHRVFAIRAADARLEFVGRDVNGDHVPDVIVQAFSGGIHCCSQATVLELGRAIQQLGTIDGADGDIVFDDLDGDGIPEAKVGDFRFAYWREYAFAETQVPDVILAWRDGAYRPACDLMREDAPTPATLTRKARELTQGWTAGDPPVAFWGYALDLIYDGHADIAWRFLDRAWPAGIDGKDEFLGDMRDKLRGSPCWSPPEAPGRAT